MAIAWIGARASNGGYAIAAATRCDLVNGATAAGASAAKSGLHKLLTTVVAFTAGLIGINDSRFAKLGSQRMKASKAPPTHVKISRKRGFHFYRKFYTSNNNESMCSTDRFFWLTVSAIEYEKCHLQNDKVVKSHSIVQMIQLLLTRHPQLLGTTNNSAGTSPSPTTPFSW
jgi:hypothetical protein